MDLSQIVDVLCRAWSPEYDQPRTVRDDFTLTGLSPAERRALRLKMRRLAKQAVLPLLESGAPGLFIDRRCARPAAHGAFRERRKGTASG